MHNRENSILAKGEKTISQINRSVGRIYSVDYTLNT